MPLPSVGRQRVAQAVNDLALDGDVDHLVRRYMREPVRHEVVSETQTVGQMVHRFLSVHQLDKPQLVAAIARHNYRTLMLVRTKRGADRLRAWRLYQQSVWNGKEFRSIVS